MLSFLSLLIISNCYILYFYFYLDDSLSTLIINGQTINSGHEARYQSNFQTQVHMKLI